MRISKKEIVLWTASIVLAVTFIVLAIQLHNQYRARKANKLHTAAVSQQTKETELIKASQAKDAQIAQLAAQKAELCTNIIAAAANPKAALAVPAICQ